MTAIKKIFLLLLFFSLSGCKTDDKEVSKTFSEKGKPFAVEYATGFSITDYGDYKIITVRSPA